MNNSYDRIVIPRGLLTGTVTLLAVQWLLYLVDRQAWPGLTGSLVVTGLAVANVVVTAVSRRAKIACVRVLQRWLLNPLLRLAHALGLNPLGLVVLETRGRVSGRPRRTPVGDGRRGDTLWLVAEHGLQAKWVRNVLADPHVRVRMRCGLRYRWVSGVAEVLVDDDPIARQRQVCRWRPLRMLNAATVRVLGADLVTVRITLAPEAVAANEPVVVAA